MSLLNYTLRIGDSSLILAQRLAEWCTNGPTLEEDIALTNISLDLFGQANGFLEYAATLDGVKTADDFAFKRNENQYYNFLITEIENGHFGDTIIRQFLFSAYLYLFFQKLATSKDEVLSALAAKSLKEIKYHLKHCSSWVIRLGDGTNESNEKIQSSINKIWEYTGELFELDQIEKDLVKKEIAVNREALKFEWDQIINTTLNQAKLMRPKDQVMKTGGSKGIHTKHLELLLKEMQFIPRKYPDAKW
ncbi:MAG: phenylacetate-CoA oxygenase subunit PaaI [Flavobacteriales bacterium]|nr:phenylacetate-CoA oxygenase subunit PaaI [Flavobacteriales bacterium]|tara:strand:+ start:1128 stop:1871 length:744 start_codon:yes stop_codon:yes gene_type:complete